MIKQTEISMKFHPRAFAAFGSDLVTNDAVAITELVKNCYDAYANYAAVVFGEDKEGTYIEIIDDGLGMTQDIIATAWSVIATPYKENHPCIERNGKRRIVSGNKGLGRFSAARLGHKMRIITHNSSDICFSAEIDWNEFLNSDSIEKCKVYIKEFELQELLRLIKKRINTDSETGTIIRIYDLNEVWTEEEILPLRNSLARLISPFDVVEDFAISLFYGKSDQKIIIEPLEFIKKPLYRIQGSVDEKGDVYYLYQFAPRGTPVNEENNIIEWELASKGFDNNTSSIKISKDDAKNKYCGGSFSFEIRAWDLDADSVGEIHDVFKIKKREIRQTISTYKGISIYRDNVLVLPKSDAARDWLGIDIRRVSSLGKRLSTSQMIGILSISSEGNPELKDTTDREKLVDTLGYKQFCKIVETIIATLENYRNFDKKVNEPLNNPTLTDLLTPLDTSKLESKVQLMIQEGASKEDILDVVHEYGEDTAKNLGELNDRLIYYAQTASLGSIAIVIMHEIRQGMTVIKRFLKRIKPDLPVDNKRTEEYFYDAEASHQRLLEVADSFAPLYKKELFKEKCQTSVLQAIQGSIRLIGAKKEAKKVLFKVELQRDYLTVLHTGEIQTVLINLLDNACYWLRKNIEKRVLISVKKVSCSHIEISVSDNGPGVQVENKEKIFQPGITAKPQGIGMGLVIVTELLNNYNCKIRLETPGEIGGATFVFDVPLGEG